MTNPATGQPVTWSSLLGLVPVLVLTLALATGWADLKSDVNGQTLRIDAVSGQFAERVRAADTRETDQEGRLRALEASASRSDEKFSAILDTLQDIKEQLDRAPVRP